MAQTPVPDSSVPLVSRETGRPTEQWYAFLRKIASRLSLADQATTDLNGAKASNTQTVAEAVLIEYPSDKDYPFLSLAWDGTIEIVTTKASSGSCTVTVYINDVALGGGANSASTTEQVITHASRNEIADGDDITITISSNSACTDLSITLRGTKTLA